MRASPGKVRVNYFCFARSQPIQTTNGRLTRSIGRASLDKAKKEICFAFTGISDTIKGQVNRVS